MAGAGLHQEPYSPKGRAGCSGAHPPRNHGQPVPQSRGQPSPMATTGILPFEHPLDSVGPQESCPRRHSPVLNLLTLSLLPVQTLQLTQGLSPAQGNGPSPETKDMSASMGKASARILLWSTGEECSLYTHPLQDAKALTGLQRHVNKMMEKTMQDG